MQQIYITINKYKSILFSVNATGGNHILILHTWKHKFKYTII